MPESNKKPDGDHIEELLSQLKGIFGQLSDAEQAEAKQKITPPPTAAPATPPTIPKPAPAPIPAPLPIDEPLAPQSFGAPPEPDPVQTIPFNSAPELSEPQAPPPVETGYAPNEITVPEGATLLPSAVFYPAGRDNEARTVVGKVERITPKFTKVAVVINVQALAPYEPKSDLRGLLPSIGPAIKAVFVLVDKPLDDTRRKAMLGALEPRGIYFQDIPIPQIEKKAIYTDMLLGMVFFFDSQKGSGGSGEATS
jgi:hypothetical protein